jgi:TorA maturation chaperone TorD
MKTPVQFNVTCRRGLQEAALWRFLSVLFERPRPGWSEQLEALAADLQDDRLNDSLQSVRQADEGVYLKLLGPGGQVSPREISYRRLADPAAILADLKAYYEAFAYSPQTEEPPDHISTELGFAGFLRLKQVYAESERNSQGAELCRDALERFLETHLLEFAAAFAQKISSCPDSYLTNPVRALSHFVQTDDLETLVV